MVEEELARMGGVATRAALVRLSSRAAVDAALAGGRIERCGRGRYGLPTIDAGRRAAHALSATLCLTSAALYWGWAVKSVPEQPQVSVPKNRKIAPDRARGIELRRLTMHADDVVDGVTTQDRTLIDCLRHLPFDQALAIADSALRSGFSHQRLRALVRDARGTGGPKMRRIAELATAASANPFESVLRAIALTVTGLTVVPQVRIYAGSKFLGRPDLVDECLGIAIEADSFEWHGGRADLKADARRYNRLVVNGWMVLRFSWEDVMFQPLDVKSVLEAAVDERTRSHCTACRPAS